ncbi:hypothetical protein ACO229_06555 [Promicromonospora sp. MS192]|uniref:ApeA N-terminal domain 1-containing protein n=1 Tax=Promicromonospora sp. MS192 TaxID=3412684 RepID=UPI003C2C347A
MGSNELVVGEPRLGWFVDGNPDTEHVAVMLRDTGTAIELQVPLKDMYEDGDSYSRWFARGISFGDDPGRTKYSYAPPRVVQFEDSSGTVTLVGCRAAGSWSNFNVGRGRIVANYAVLGGKSLRLEKINGLRTEIPALAAWTRLSNMTVDVQRDPQGLAQSVQMRLTNAPEIRLARPMNLTMKSSWQTSKDQGNFTAAEGVRTTTATKEPRSWDDHIAVHGAVLDLVSIAGWRPFGFSKIQVNRADDPHRDGAGGNHGPKWSQVATHRLLKHEPWDRDPNFLFQYSEIGPRGIARWLRLRKEFGQAIGPLLNILRSEDQWSSSNVVQSGIALEALGYLIDLANGGANMNSRRQINFRPALQVVLDDMRHHPFGDTTGWIDRATDVYMSAKHPDRPQPDSLVALNTLRENLLVLRYWVAQRLGARGKSMQRALSRDPLYREWVALD